MFILFYFRIEDIIYDKYVRKDKNLAFKKKKKIRSEILGKKAETKSKKLLRLTQS